MNKLLLGLSAALIAGSAACVSAAPAVTGDYIEARSCNVYAGPCHFGSEYTTAGREAVMAWRVQRGASGARHWMVSAPSRWSPARITWLWPGCRAAPSSTSTSAPPRRSGRR